MASTGSKYKYPSHLEHFEHLRASSDCAIVPEINVDHEKVVDMRWKDAVS